MDPIPKMVISSPLARRKGEIEVGSEQEIDELISQLIIAKAGIRGAQSAIGAQGAMDAAREVETERAGQAAAGEDAAPAQDEAAGRRTWGDIFRENPAHPASDARLAADPAAIPTADGEHVTCPACGFRDGRHNPAGCRRQEKLADLGKQVARLSRPAPLAAVRPLRPDSEVTIIGSVTDSSTFRCCRTPIPWPAKGMDVTCPDCRSIWEREQVDIGAGARLKVSVVDGEVVYRRGEHGAAS